MSAAAGAGMLLIVFMFVCVLVCAFTCFLLCFAQFEFSSYAICLHASVAMHCCIFLRLFIMQHYVDLSGVCV